jgi:hypothetical protein
MGLSLCTQNWTAVITVEVMLVVFISYKGFVQLEYSPDGKTLKQNLCLQVWDVSIV